MPFLDVPSAAPTPSSFLLDDTKLAAGRPQAPQELAEASITMPGGSRVDAGPTAGCVLTCCLSDSGDADVGRLARTLSNPASRSLRSEVLTPLVRRATVPCSASTRADAPCADPSLPPLAARLRPQVVSRRAGLHLCPVRVVLRAPALCSLYPPAPLADAVRRPCFQPTFPKGTKLFVNVAHHALVPEPPAAPAGAAPTLLEDLWIPAVVGEMAVTVDKGRPPRPSSSGAARLPRRD